MRLITIDRCEAGLELGKSIYNDKGHILLSKGTKLTDPLIKSLKKHQVFTIYIEDKDSEGIDIIESIPEELRMESLHIVTEGLIKISELSPNARKIDGMFKTGRAIRSFQKVFRDLLGCLKENPTALNLLATTKVHDHYIYNHSLNVAIYACQLALENGLPLNKIEEIGLGAILHDVGFAFISQETLNQPRKLTVEEYNYVKTHTELGFDLLRKIHEIPLPVAHCALQHHERIDGTGYPRGLKEQEIHPYAKILSVADVFDAVTNHRVYREGILPHKGIQILIEGSGTQFDPKQVNHFKKCVAIYPEGLSVTLNNGLSGIVSTYNFDSAGRPTIRILKDEEGHRVTPYEIDLSLSMHEDVEIVEAEGLLT
ncbi:HD-GYP domain-containing protein [Cytobacillus spongiae]|jgi:HD-GYP domain-containing protein (c-di-GMP phosphodiesterase class II)|uniref:HD-GYP domain-containing protein n=1 Tax=Cytobacillus spongiae TaxID=2901381 RepID=UPI001F22DBF9|nr:HD-GYP domain-containing protein [Cytobacillus spongiae]UII54213.1 HD-GYP domain-containing protein [Cytobacillus spongiae]